MDGAIGRRSAARNVPESAGGNRRDYRRCDMNSAFERDPPQQSGQVILLPKHLRLDWMDVLALDPELSPTAYKVAGVLGYHFNRHRGDTFIKQETIARVLGLSLRTVQNAIIELERRGYLIVRRRDL